MLGHRHLGNTNPNDCTLREVVEKDISVNYMSSSGLEWKEQALLLTVLSDL
jgi:hypothetical protein